MNRIEKLKGQIKAIDAKLDALLAGDSLTSEQQTEHDALVAERATLVSALSKALEMAKAANDRAVEFTTLEASANSVADLAARRPPGVGQRAAKDGPDNLASATGQRTDPEGRVTGYFEATDEEITLRVGETPEAIRRRSYRQQNKVNRAFLRSAGYQPWGEFRSCRDFIRDGLENHQHSRFRDRCIKHYAAVQGMSEGVGADGGYLVMPEFATGIIDRVYNNDLWGRTDNYSVTGNNLTFLANSETSRATGSRGLRGYWLQGEGATLTKSKPTFREVTLKLVKLGVLVYLTQELLDDSGSALEQYISRKAAEEFNFMIGDAIINGTGVGQPLGILNYPSLVSVAKETGQTAATIQTENVEKMYARFYMPNISGLTWYHNQDILPQLNTMSLGIGTAGVPTYLPPGGLSVAPYGMLKGRPLQPIEFAATLGTQGDLIAADLGQTLSISKGGIAQAMSMHLEFLTDQMAVRFIMRLNAGPWETAPLTPYKGTSNTQSSQVVLDTRA